MNSAEAMRGGRGGVAVGSGSGVVVGPGWVRGFEGECFLGGCGREREVEFEPMCGDSEFLFSRCKGWWWLFVMVEGRWSPKLVIYHQHCRQTVVNINSCEGHILPSMIHTNFPPDCC